MTDHARLNFSGADIWMTCPASPDMSQGQESKPTESTIFGDKAHKELEDGLVNGVRPSGSEEADCAAVAYDYVMQRLAEMGSDSQAMVEYPVAIKATGRDDMAGSADVILISPTELEIVDLKSGAGIFVDEMATPQTRLYALGAMEEFGVRDNVKLTIVQPRFWGDVEPVRTLETDAGFLALWLSNVVTKAAADTDAGLAGVVTEKCKKCDGKDVCQFRDQAVGKTLTGELMPTTHDATEMAIIRRKDLLVYDNDKLADTLHLIPVIRDFCDSLEEHAKEIIMNGEEVPGFKVVETAGRKKWLNEEQALEALGKSRVKKADYLKETLRTPNQVLSLKISKELEKKLKGVIGITGGGLTLTMASDPRESAAPAFKVIPEQVDIAEVIEDASPAPLEQEVDDLPDYLK